jgi:hypothetical protein
MIEQYIALGDGLSMDPLLFGLPDPKDLVAKGAASLLASELARNYRCGRYKNLCRERSRMSSIWLHALPSILPTRGQVVVTITTGLEDVIDMGLELQTPGQVRSAVHETVEGYHRLVRTLRRLLPNSLIIGTAIPNVSDAAQQFNELLNWHVADGFVVADPGWSFIDAWASRKYYQLNSGGCEAIAAAWLGEVLKTGITSLLDTVRIA